ncbi:unnamed protein product, partial [Rotaria sordida]
MTSFESSSSSSHIKDNYNFYS